MPRLIIETDSCITSNKTRDRPALFLSVISIILSISSVAILYYQVFYQRSMERQNDLLSYRNLACFATRYIDAAVTGLKNGNHIDDIAMETVMFSIDQVKVTELPDPVLVEGFIDIRHFTLQLKAWSADHVLLNNDIERQMEIAVQRSDAAMKEIDDFIIGKRLPTNSFARGCNYARAS